MVFPEAKRSYDNDIKRFHKGAFYLAEQFDLDIVPVYIHGNSEVLPKGDFIIYDGAITVKVGDRINKDDLSFGTNYSERTKKINALFREKFSELRTELEDENYFRKKLFLSFLYKENEVVKEIKRDFEANKSVYFELNQYIAKDTVILHIADDYGQKDVLLSLYHASRKIFSFIGNEEKREIAGQNYIVKTRKISYIKNISNVNKNIDVLLISDDHFSFSKISDLPETVILLKTKALLFTNQNYSLIFESGAIKIYKKNHNKG